jgi:hypothetical protein
MDNTIETSKVITNDAGAFRLQVVADPEGTGNPREEYDGHLGVMVADYYRHILPQEGEFRMQILAGLEDERRGFRLVSRWLRVFRGATVVLPIFSSGGNELRLSAGTVDDNADGAAIGVIYDTPETRKELNEGVTPEQVAEWLRAEVDQYTVWACGEMTAWEVQRLAGDDGDDEAWEPGVESCGGYYSTEEAREAGLPELERIAAEALAAHIEDLHAQALVENEQHGWTSARRSAERALAVLRQSDPRVAEAGLDWFGEGGLGTEALCDLVADLLHLSYLNGVHPGDVTNSALRNWIEETIGEDCEVAAEAHEENAAGYDHSRAKEDGRNA